MFSPFARRSGAWPNDEVKIPTSCTGTPKSRYCPASPAGDDAFDLMTAGLPYDVRGHFTPDVALLEVTAAALGLACPPGCERLDDEGLTDRYLSDLALDDRTVLHRTQYAIHTAACLRGGLHADLLGEAGGWERGCGRTPSGRSSSTSERLRTVPA